MSVDPLINNGNSKAGDPAGEAVPEPGILVLQESELPYLDVDKILEEARQSLGDATVPGSAADAADSIDDTRSSSNAIEYINTIGDEKASSNTPNYINTIDDAWKAVDSSNLPPAPVHTPRPFVPVSRAAKPEQSSKGQTAAREGGAGGDGSDSSDDSIIDIFKEKLVLFINFIKPASLWARIKNAEPGKNRAKKDPSEFTIKFDFESAYKDPPEDNPLRRRRERRTGLVGGVLFALFMLSTALVLASLMWMATIDVLGFAASDEPVDIYVPEDFTIESITDLLYESGLIQYKQLFGLFADFSDAGEKIKPGSYVLNKNFDYRALVQGMTARSGVRVETTVVIPEGFTLSQIFILLEREDVCSAQDLWDAAANHDFSFYFLDKETLGDRLRLEGFLFPDTYNFYKNSSAVSVILKMLREFNNKFTEMYVERADYLGYTVRDIVIIASMIEREAANDDERSRISAVIHNRLNNPATFPMLEIDATINYARAGTDIAFSIQWDNEFNTYLYPGLPPGPIAAPGITSIQAALYPLTTNEYFYALHKDGTHRFFRNASDHNRFVNSDEYGG